MVLGEQRAQEENGSDYKPNDTILRRTSESFLVRKIPSLAALRSSLLATKITKPVEDASTVLL